MRIAWNQVLSAFLIGCLLGTLFGIRHEKKVFHQFWDHGPNTQKVLSKLSKKLDLSAQQEDQVHALLEEKRQKLMSLHQEMTAQFDAIRLSMRSDMMKILSPDQQKKFIEMTQRWDERRKKR
jgi:Spy/CpxP family protein refolding chaperone